MVTHTSHYLFTSGGVRKKVSSQLPTEENAKPFLAIPSPSSPSLHTPKQPELTKPVSSHSKGITRSSRLTSKFWQSVGRIFTSAPKKAANTPQVSGTPQKTLQNQTSQETLQSRPENLSFAERDSLPPPEETTSIAQDVKPLVSSLGADPDKIEELLDKFHEGLRDLMLKRRESDDLVLYYSIRVLDSGGQPQFHEVVSIVLPAVTGIVSVFKLSESLDVHGEVVMGYRPMIPTSPTSPMSR